MDAHAWNNRGLDKDSGLVGDARSIYDPNEGRGMKASRQVGTVGAQGSKGRRVFCFRAPCAEFRVAKVGLVGAISIYSFMYSVWIDG